MSFQLKNIDRAIEWALKDAFIEAGYWPDQRTYDANNDLAGFKADLNARRANKVPTVDVFGTGNYTDRGQLQANNVIIERKDMPKGSIGFAYPYQTVLQPNKTYSKFKTPEGTNNIGYEIRFVAFDVEMDRAINEIIKKVFDTRKFIYGINDDVSNMTEGFWIFESGTPIDISGKDFVERIYMYHASDVVIESGNNVVQANIPPLKTLYGPTMNPNKADADIAYPEAANDLVTQYGVIDLFIQFVEELPGWKKLEMARMYAQETEELALKNLIHGPAAINSGCSFTPFKGYFRSVDNEYIDTNFSPSNSEAFSLTNFCYMVFVTEIPGTTTLMELFGLNDMDNVVSVLMRGSDGIGIEAKGNGDDLLSDSALRLKPNTLYTLNRRDRFSMQIFAGDVIIATLLEEPTFIPNGNIFDLNIGDQNGNPIGIGTVGGIAFSAAGPGLRGSEIRQLNIAIREYLTRLGVIVS